MINSLAYQILPPPPGSQNGGPNNKQDDLGSAGYSSPSSSTTSSPQNTQNLMNSPVAVRKRPVADDTDGHLAYLPGDVLGDRYEIVSTLGKWFYHLFNDMQHKFRSSIALIIITV